MNSLEVTSVLKDSQHNFFLRITSPVPRRMVVIITPVPPLIPAIFQLIHTCTAGQLADFLQNRLIHRLTVAVDAGRVDFKCCKQNILFGIHDGQHIFEALRGVLASTWTCIPQLSFTMPPARRSARTTSCSFSISLYSSLGEFSSTL